MTKREGVDGPAECELLSPTAFEQAREALSKSGRGRPLPSRALCPHTREQGEIEGKKRLRVAKSREFPFELSNCGKVLPTGYYRFIIPGSLSKLRRRHPGLICNHAEGVDLPGQS